MVLQKTVCFKSALVFKHAASKSVKPDKVKKK